MNITNKNRFVLSGGNKSKSLELLKQKSVYMFEMGIPFEVTRSGSSYSLDSDLYSQKMSSKKMSGADANFIKKVKNKIKNNDVAFDFIDEVCTAKDVRYINVNPLYREGVILEDLVCLDINSAYWKTALLMGVIDEDLYKEGMEKGKVTRLASLGSLAKTKEIWSFDGENFEIKQKVKSYETEHIWFAICKRVSDLMEGVAMQLGNDFIFYWVDGIYFKNTPRNIELVSDYFAKFGYENSEEKISRIEFKEFEFDVFGYEEGYSKTFSYKHQNKSTKRYDTIKGLKELTNIKGIINSCLRGDYDYLDKQ